MKLRESTDNPIAWMEEKKMICCQEAVKMKFDRKELSWNGTCQTCQTAWTIAISTFQIIKK